MKQAIQPEVSSHTTSFLSFSEWIQGHSCDGATDTPESMKNRCLGSDRSSEEIERMESEQDNSVQNSTEGMYKNDF